MRPYIKKVEIHNYKTHRHTRLMFSNGINSIVGPNGVGKSNIVEAIIFCLGERSPKNLRVSNFNELIYNFRKDLDLSVTLTIVDSDGNEHKFKRIYSRKKGHIYRYNGKNISRTSYLINLLKLGGKGFKYVYIRQGDITRWAEASPKEIRDMIHEALGIKQYNLKRKEAIEKLRQAEAKLEGIQTNYREMQKMIYEIRDLLIAHETRKNISNMMNLIDASLTLEELQRLEEKYKKIQNREAALDKLLTKLKKKEMDLENKLESYKEGINKLRKYYEKYEELSRDVNNTILSLLSKENMIRSEIKENKLNRINIQIEYLNENIKRERQKAIEEGKIIKEKIRTYKLYNKELEKLKKIKEAKEAKLSEIEEEISNLEKEKLKKLNEYSNKVRENIDEYIKRGVIESRRKEIQREISELDKRIASYRDTINNLKNKKNELVQDLKKLKEKLDTLKKQHREYGRRKKRVEKEIGNAYKLLSKLDRLIENIRKDGFNEGRYYREAKTTLEVCNKIKINGVYGILSDLIKGPRNILNLLKDLDVRGWYSIIVNNYESALEVLKIAKDLKKDVHVKIVDQSNLMDIPDNSILYKLKYSKKIEPLLIKMYGDIVLTNSLDEALDIVQKGFRAAYLDGNFLIYSGGAISSGRILIKVPKDIDTIISVRNKFRDVITKREKYLKELENRERSLDRSIQEEYVRIVNIRLTINFIDKNIKFFENIIKRLKNKKIEKEKLLKEYKDIANKREEKIDFKEIDRKIELLRKDSESLTKDIEEINSQISNLFEKIIEIKSDISTFKNINRERKEKIKQYKLKINSLKMEIPNLKESIKSKAKQLATIRKQIENLKNKNEKIKTKLNKLNEKSSEINRKIGKAMDMLKKIREKENEFLDKKNRLKNKMFILNKEIGEIKKKLRELKFNEVSIKDERMGTKIYEKLREEEEEIPETSEMINKWYHDKIEPYKIYSLRRAELIAEKEEILKFIREIDEKREEIFFKGFKEIRDRFINLFKEVFQDGEVEIKLSKEDDIDSEVLIYVKFKDKPKILLSTASGGEKTSLILLLLFSIYSVNRDTIFILDEVDAHMDLRIVDNIASIIKAQKKYSQIILVTLPGHDSMINIADIVIPVTYSRQSSKVFPIKREMLDRVSR